VASITVIRVNNLNTKFVIANPYLLPTEAVVDPQCCDSLPSNVVASTGFDLCCHALECYTARAHTQHAKIEDPNSRQYIQGANPFSAEARDKLMWGASLAGIAFGNCGTHLPHAMSYGITHLMSDITTEGYNIASPFVPHGISVVIKQRHMNGARYLGADTKGATIEDAGEVLSNRLIELMRNTHMPNGLTGVGFKETDIKALAESSVRQSRAIANAPRESNIIDIENMYSDALSYW